jgi:ABC-2 type transport system permease protein
MSDSPSVARAPMSDTRPLYWSVRRELWENRSVYLAPLIVAAIVLLASFAGTVGLPKRIRNASSLDPVKLHVAVVKPFHLLPAAIMFTSFLVGMFFSLEALYGERRERSILFWKSLPVSDRTTVLSKAGIPFLVLPLIAFALSVVGQFILLLWSTMVLLANGVSPALLFAELQLFQGWVVMLYGLTVHVLWFAPIYGWFMLISSWARRAPFLWAVLPVLTVSAVERIVFNTWSFMQLLQYRVTGAMKLAFSAGGQHVIDRFSQLDPLTFLSSAGLWSGLVFAAAFLVLAVRLRRYREPI